jgi:DUF4097 and DUF4098 domain-containing protein YvlB
MKLVQEGKLTADDAAELIEAFESSPKEEDHEEPVSVGASAEAKVDEGAPPKADESKSHDPFASVIEAIEKIGKDVSNSVNWSEVANQLKEGTKRGVEAIKHAAEQAKAGGSWTIFGGIKASKDVELPLDITPGKTLRIENAAGDVSVFGGHSTGLLIAHAHLRGKDSEDAKEKAASYTPVIEESDHTVLIRQPDVSGLSVMLEVRVPAGVQVEIRCEAGDIVVDATASGCRIDGKSGDIRLTGLDGAIEVDTSSGDVWISESKATALTLEGKSGDVKIERVKGNISVRTSAGNVRLMDVAGRTISIEAVSGDVHLDVSEPVEGSVNVRTVNGDTRVNVADGSNCRVALSTLRGSVHSELFLKDEARLDQRITGTLGDGAGTIDISAVNGDVSLALRDTAAV